MNWSIYLISNGTRTYIGSTTDVNRRLRQHNGEIVGGARSTRGHKWKLVCFANNFKTRSEACRWERILKCRARGLQKRKDAMWHMVCDCKCPAGKGITYVVPDNLSFTLVSPGGHNHARFL